MSLGEIEVVTFVYRCAPTKQKIKFHFGVKEEEVEWKSLLYVYPDTQGNVYSLCLETFFELISSHSSDISEMEPDCTFKADKGNMECFSTNILFRGEAAKNVCDYLAFLSIKPHVWALGF